MRAYVDTNILVDLVLSRQEFLPNAQRIFALGYAGEVQLVVSALSFVNTIYLGRKYKFPMDDVLSKLRMIADFVDVADLSGQNVVDMLPAAGETTKMPHSIARPSTSRQTVLSHAIKRTSRQALCPYLHL